MTRSFVSLSRAVVASIGFTVLASSVAAAQTPAAPSGSTTSSASAGVPWFASAIQGKTVWITADGARVRGSVTSLSTTGLTLVEDGAPTAIPYDKIVRVEKASHRLRNGAWIGFASGAALGMLAGVRVCDGDCAGWEYLVFSGYYGGLGAAAGVGIGAIANAGKKGGDVIYDARRRTTTMSLAPILSPTRKGMAFSMTWR
jgi:hypothetical protein